MIVTVLVSCNDSVAVFENVLETVPDTEVVFEAVMCSVEDTVRKAVIVGTCVTVRIIVIVLVLCNDSVAVLKNVGETVPDTDVVFDGVICSVKDTVCDAVMVGISDIVEVID
eukprot:PhM_4_TR18491/c1_g1_i1/m.11605